MLRSVWAEGSAKQPNEPVPGVGLARSLDAVARPQEPAASFPHQYDGGCDARAFARALLRAAFFRCAVRLNAFHA